MHVVVTSRLGHAVEVGGGTHGIGAHVFEDDPVAGVQLGQRVVLFDTVQAVAGGSPDTTGELSIIIVRLLGEEQHNYLHRNYLEKFHHNNKTKV